ncbi:MAG: CdaR family protein [Thermosulfidibacteraceae bacterium]
MRVDWRVWFERIIALIIGILIWGYVNSQGIVEIAYVVPIEYRDIGSNMIIKSNLPQTATVRLRGNPWIMNKIESKDISVIFSFSEARAGFNRIKVSSVKVPSGVEVVNVVPEYIDVEVGFLVEKEVPVAVVWMRKPKHSFRYYPETVVIKGEAYRIKNINRVYTKPIDGKLLTKVKHLEVKLMLPGNVFSDTKAIKIEVD